MNLSIKEAYALVGSLIQTAEKEQKAANKENVGEYLEHIARCEAYCDAANRLNLLIEATIQDAHFYEQTGEVRQ